MDSYIQYTGKQDTVVWRHFCSTSVSTGICPIIKWGGEMREGNLGNLGWRILKSCAVLFLSLGSGRSRVQRVQTLSVISPR
jgi:hypothetical protein